MASKKRVSGGKKAVSATASYEKVFRERARESARVKLAILKGEIVKTAANLAGAMVKALREGHQAFFFGNGGSAADAQHLAAELVGKYYYDRPPLPSLALATNTSCVTAIGNDYGYDLTFARQIQAHGRAGDVAIGLSTSGNSPNVVAGLRVAQEMGMITAGLTGARMSKMAEFSTFLIRIPSDETPRIQEGHMLIGHVICEIIESELFPKR
jgi:D-sedoheptulose 7-phosphate isomerase